MTKIDKVIKGLECLANRDGGCRSDCPYYKDREVNCVEAMAADTLALLKEQEEVEPTINEYGEAYCVCGENVGIIPSSKTLPSIRSKYCSECGRRMKWKYD